MSAELQGVLMSSSVTTRLLCVVAWLSVAVGGTCAAGEVPSFRHEVMPVLSRAGCSLGTCHGNQNGKGGLRLSLRGQDPDLDYTTLTRTLGARRVNVQQPEDSLLLRKPLMQVPHEGGRRFVVDSFEYRVLRDWIAAGMPRDGGVAGSGLVQLKGLQVEPELVTLSGDQRTRQLTATAEFSDGTRREVNELAVFESSHPGVSVSASGLVDFGEVSSVRQTTVTVRYLNQQQVSRVEYLRGVSDFRFESPVAVNAIDEAVFGQLRRLQLNPAGLCSDEVFVRRLYLDLTGLLPTREQAESFLRAPAADRRARLIDRLLESEEFVDFQTLRWADLLRVEDKTLDAKGVSVFHQWIRASVRGDRPLNEFAAALTGARGSTYTEPAANFYRALRTPEERSESAAQVFLGVRLQCARCHNHPFDRWTQDDYYGWTNFFARVDYKILENRRRDINDKHEFDGEQLVFMKARGDVKNPRTGERAELRFLGAVDERLTAAAGREGADRLQVLSEWLMSEQNDRFVATQANRIWQQLMGQGVVDPIDDFRGTNPPSNPELLEVLVREFRAGGLRVRPLMRLILNSAVWQQSAESAGGVELSDTDAAPLFVRAIPRRLTAEQLLDGIGLVLGAAPRFGGQPAGVRAVQLAGVRGGGHRYSRPESGDRFLSLFGKPGRIQTCECERLGETTLAQTMELVSGVVVSDLLGRADNCISESLRAGESTESFVEALWWRALSRPPSAAEVGAMVRHVSEQSDRRRGLEDVVWAVLNSNEFLLRQ